jgi:hypothetical protein
VNTDGSIDILRNRFRRSVGRFDARDERRERLPLVGLSANEHSVHRGAYTAEAAEVGSWLMD